MTAATRFGASLVELALWVRADFGATSIARAEWRAILAGEGLAPGGELRLVVGRCGANAERVRDGYAPEVSA